VFENGQNRKVSYQFLFPMPFYILIKHLFMPDKRSGFILFAAHGFSDY
jgi:hypothetical protein